MGSQQSTAQKIGPYELIKEWNEDIFGITYEAKHSSTQAPYLVQVLSPFVCNRENFIIRFELLRTIIPYIRHKNLLNIEEMGQTDQLFFLAKGQSSSSLSEAFSFEKFSYRDTPKRFEVLTSLLTDIAEGLNFLETFSKSYYKDGISCSSFHPKNLLLVPQKASSKEKKNLQVLLDGYAESFLFFGDEISSPYLHHYYSLKSQSKKASSFSFLQSYLLFPRSINPKKAIDQKDVQGALGALLYKTISGKTPSGKLESLKKFEPTLPNTLENICTRCLQAPYKGGYNSFKDLLQDLRSFTPNPSSTSLEKKLESLEIPQGMSLIYFSEKVLLGANEGPLIERPTFKAKVTPFLLDKRPVSNREFAAFMPSYKRSSYSQEDNSPATCISLKMAQDYCDYRSKKEGLPLGTYRLPTEYEWEAAARGSLGEQYPWGKEPNSQKLHSGHAPSTGAIVSDHFPAGRFFLYGMLGNTWEWTSSSFKPHPFSKHLEKGYNSSLQVAKGGCWFTPLEECRASLRGAFPPGERKGNIGFRCARSIPN